VLCSDILIVNLKFLFCDIVSMGSHGCCVDSTMCNDLATFDNFVKIFMYT